MRLREYWRVDSHLRDKVDRDAESKELNPSASQEDSKAPWAVLRCSTTPDRQANSCRPDTLQAASGGVTFTLKAVAADVSQRPKSETLGSWSRIYPKLKPDSPAFTARLRLRSVVGGRVEGAGRT